MNPFQAIAPDLAQLPLDPVAGNGVPHGSRNRQPEPRLAGVLFTLEPVEDEEPRRGRAPLAVDSVEVSRARQAVPALHCAALRGETLPALCAAALQNRAARTRRHARTKAVLALPPAHVGLVGPFHEVEEGGKCPKEEPWRASIEEHRYTELSTVVRVRSASKCDQLSDLIHRCGESCGVRKTPANPADFIPSFHAL